MAQEARKFPQELEARFTELGLWQGLTDGGKDLLRGLGAKLEPFAVPNTAEPGRNDLRGFELLAHGAGGASFFVLKGKAKAAEVSTGVLGLALFQVALLTANALVREMGTRISGRTWEKLNFSINVDGAMLAHPALTRLLETTPRPPFPVLMEASEDLQVSDVPPLRRLLDQYPWLSLALDDSDQLAFDTRSLLPKRVCLVKADGKYVRKLYRDREKGTDYLCGCLRDLRQDRVPFVAEGVESEEIKRYLQDRWDVSAHGELWMQGYHIQLSPPWTQVLQPLNIGYPDTPEGYVLPEQADVPAFRKEYLDRLGLSANVLPLFSGESGDPIRLSAVYTALRTRGGDSEDMAVRKSAEVENLSALEALDRHRYLVLMGGPGSGKSTFLNFLALCMAGELQGRPDGNLDLLRTPLPSDSVEQKKESRPQAWGHGALLPVRVILRDFAADLPRDGSAVGAVALERFITSQLPRPAYGPHLLAELRTQGGLVLLDGLDEVPDALHRREQVKQAVQDFTALYGRCRFLVTSRTYAYQRQDWKLAGFVERELLPFSRGQIEAFVDAWYAHMVHSARLTQSDAETRAEGMKRATRRRELAELAERPLLLTLMAQLQTKGGGSLPDKREKLYALSVDMLLEQWEGLKARKDADGKWIVEEPSLSEWLGASREAIRKELDKLAYLAHLKQPDLTGTADIRQEDVILALAAASRNQVDTRIHRLEEYLRDRAGLLNSHGEGLYQFPHRSFQEYLAACHLARLDDPDTLASLATQEPGRWREVLLLAATYASATPGPVWELAEALCPEDAPKAEEAGEVAQWGALLAGQVLAECGLAASVSRHEKKRLRVRDWQVRLLESTVLPSRERALAGDLLAALGDPRARLLEVDSMRFCAVPAGPFWMGVKDSEHSTVHLNEHLNYDYWIGETPVSVAHFRQFLNATGQVPGHPECLNAPENRPVTEVSWRDAMDFCDWLTNRWRGRLPAGWRVILPSQAEWQKAARGGLMIPVSPCLVAIGEVATWAGELLPNPLPHRTYPWGEGGDLERMNCQSSVGTASTPGCFPSNVSPYACVDMAGNVFEWCRSQGGRDLGNSLKSPSDTKAGSPDSKAVEGDSPGCFLGGSWWTDLDSGTCYSICLCPPDFSSPFSGFRVMLCNPPV